MILFCIFSQIQITNTALPPRMMLLLAQRVRANYSEQFASKSCTADGKMTAIHVVMKQGGGEGGGLQRPV